MARKIVVVANFPVNDKEFMFFATNVATCFTNNPYVPNPPVGPAALLVLIGAMKTADDAADKKVLGAVADRAAKRAKVESALRQDEAYLQGIVAQASPEDAENILAGSGFAKKKSSVQTKPPYAVKRGAVEGSVDLHIKALAKHGRVVYCNAYSLDGGKTWIDATPTVETTTTITGLPIGQTALFRFRPLVKLVYGDWSQTQTFVVH